MRERSQIKGMDYQKSVKNWLMHRPFLGLNASPFGDTYDLSNKAAKIASSFFDFSFMLKQDDRAERILYAECKYRHESYGNINNEFKEFIKKVYSSLISCDKEEAETSEFCFISNIPPDEWRKFINNRQKYCMNILSQDEIEINSAILNNLINKMHILVLSEVIIKR